MTRFSDLCKGCGRELEPATAIPRQPCPDCGETARTMREHVGGSIAPSGSLKGTVVRPVTVRAKARVLKPTVRTHPHVDEIRLVWEHWRDFGQRVLFAYRGERTMGISIREDWQDALLDVAEELGPEDGKDD